MEAKKRINVSIPLWWPSGEGWRKAARWLLPNPGTVVLILVLLWAQSAGALPLGQQASPASPSATTINYQGRLADSGGTPVNGQVTLQFALYASDIDPTPLWGPETHPNVPVSDGLFSVILGALSAGIPQDILGGDLWLEIIVEGETLSPRERLGSVPYAMQALTVPDAAITSRNMAPSVFEAYLTSQVPIGGSSTEVLSLDVDFPIDATYVIFAHVVCKHDQGGRVISSLADEVGNPILGSSTPTLHPGGDVQSGSVTVVHGFPAGMHTVKLMAQTAGSSASGVVRSAHIIAIPFAQAP